MKKSTIYKSTLALVALVVLGSCQSMFNDPLIKTNPNSPTDASMTKTWIGAQVGFGVLMEDTDDRMGMMWAGHLTGLSRQHAGFTTYIVTTGAFGFSNPYNTVAQLRIVQQKATDLNIKRMVGAAQVLEAMIIGRAASCYGDLPYAEAWDVENFPNPKYETQSAVYSELQATLDAAIANLSLPVLPDGGNITGDFLLGNDETNWLAAAHTMKARLFLHVGNFAGAEAEALQGIGSSAGDMLIPHGESYGVDQNLDNVFFDINRPADTGCEPPTVLPTFMLAHTTGGTDESRLWNHFFEFAKYTTGDDPNTTDGMYQPNSPHPALTFFENQLILAEAIQRQNSGGVDAGALAALNAVRAELETEFFAGQPMPARGTANYPPLAATDLATNDQVGMLAEILAQKYIVMYGQGVEVWTDLRRCEVQTPIVEVMHPTSGFSIASSPIVSTPTGRIPDKYIYPQNQINTNGDNVPKGSDGKVTTQWVKLEIFQ